MNSFIDATDGVSVCAIVAFIVHIIVVIVTIKIMAMPGMAMLGMPMLGMPMLGMPIRVQIPMLRIMEATLMLTLQMPMPLVLAKLKPSFVILLSLVSALNCEYVFTQLQVTVKILIISLVVRVPKN